MKKKKLAAKTDFLIFEESEEEDALMENIFDHIKDVPDKEPMLESEPVTTPQKPRKKSPKPFNRPDAELDLHGKTREEAIMMVQNFVIECRSNRFRNALIITGKGKHSGNSGPVLKKEVGFWLKKNGKPYLKDFGDAPAHWGGTGALWLVFK